MGITAGQDILASDFINQSEKNATPSTDAGRSVKLESDGRLSGFFTRNGAVVNAGETINGGTLPVPVYQNKTDNEVYACDANDNTKYKFIGFAVSNGTNGNAITIQTSGIVSGFSGLAEGEKYYVQDAVGTINTTPGTMEILVGVAISETQLFIQKGKLRASGTTSFTSTTTTVITCGFRPSAVRITAVSHYNSAGANFSMSHGGWTVQGGNDCVLIGSDASTNCSSGTNTKAWDTYVDSDGHRGEVTTITDTGFTLDNTEYSGTTTVSIFWEAEGEL